MTPYDLRKRVPVYDELWIRLIDIPNPYRSQFYADSIGRSCPLIPGQGACFWVLDWELWLARRRHLDYTLRYPLLYRHISDEEASRTIKPYLM